MEILEITPIYRLPEWYIGLMTILLAFSIGYIVTIVETGAEDMMIMHILGIICIIAFVVLLILGINGMFSYYKCDQLTVRLDDSVKVTEFYEKYDVTHHEKYSNIYIVKTKEN